MTALLPETAPVTVTVTRRASSGRASEVLAWLKAGTTLAEDFPGFLGAGWLQPSPGSQDWHVLYRFADDASLARWESSDQRAWWLSSAQGLVSDTRVERRSGIEGWFDEPAALSVTTPAPPRWKQAVLIWSAFFPLNLALTFLLLPLPAPLAVRALVSSLLLTPVMVYVVLPRLTRAAEGWLRR